jgi:Domain of unknown function (DUF4253)
MAKSSKVDFSKTSKSPDYLKAVADLEKLTGASSRAMKDVKGGFEFRLGPAKAKSFKLEKVQGNFLKRGCFVFNNDATNSKRIAILPTTEKYDVLQAMGTNGVNWNLDSKKIIAWLRKLEKQQPLVITGVSGEHVSARFTTKVKNVEDMALRILEFSPDLDNFGELMTQLPKTGKFELWWT